MLRAVFSLVMHQRVGPIPVGRTLFLRVYKDATRPLRSIGPTVGFPENSTFGMGFICRGHRLDRLLQHDGFRHYGRCLEHAEHLLRDQSRRAVRRCRPLAHFRLPVPFPGLSWHLFLLVLFYLHLACCASFLLYFLLRC